MGAAFQPSATHAPVQRVTVPMLVEGNRPFIDLVFRRPDGSSRPARFLVDSGGGGFIVTEKLARDIGVTWGKTSREDGSEFGPALVTPAAAVGDLSLDLDPRRVFVMIGQDSILPKQAPGHADGMFPGHLLAKYHVVFDYPGGQFTLARPGVLTPQGHGWPMPVGQRSGFPRTQVEIAGESFGFLVDTGASFTIVSDAVLQTWKGRHVDWAVQPGAAGDAATLGGSTLRTIDLPGANWAGQVLRPFSMVSQREGVFETYMTAMMAGPIVGSLAGNVLKGFRVELDYQNEKVYLAPKPAR